MRLNVRTPAHSVRLEVRSVTTPAPDGAWRVAGGGEAVKDSSPGGGEHNSFLLALEREKVKRGLFSVQRETSLTGSLKHGSLENLRMTQNDGRYLIFSSSFFSRWSK